jgi:YihY family inner membrane protein
MLVLATALLVTSTISLGIGSLLGNLPLGLGLNPVLAQVMTWSISILSAIVMFLLLYKILPNAQQGWRDVIPGALLSTVLFFVILAVFPLYMNIFPPNQAYAVFGVFLVFTFWLYLLGFVFVLGAELNAFLKQPARSAALAENVVQDTPVRRASLAGRILGFIGLVFAVVMLRKRSTPAA